MNPSHSARGRTGSAHLLWRLPFRRNERSAGHPVLGTQPGAGIAPVLALGIGALGGLEVWDLARDSWSTESGAHGPLVMAGALAVIWRERHAFAWARRQPLWPRALLLGPLLALFVLARITEIRSLELASGWGCLLVVAWVECGATVLRRLWFPAMFMPLATAPPGELVAALTGPAKLWLTDTAVGIADMAGLAAGASGTIIQIDGYQLQVATACSGINSLVGIVALGLFYVYWRHGGLLDADAARHPSDHVLGHALILCLALVPVAIAANLLRILLLILAVHGMGDRVLAGVAHPLAGFAVFAISIALMFVADGIVLRCRGWRR